MHRSAGFTLQELVLTLALTAVVVGIGAPSLTRFVLDNRRTADINAFVTAVQLARSEAAKRARPVVLCQSTDMLSCGDPDDYGLGWIVFVNEDGKRPPARSPREPLLLGHSPASDGPIHSNRRSFEFRPFYRRSTNGTVTFCDRRGAAEARAVIISYTSRPRVADRGPGNRKLTC